MPETTKARMRVGDVHTWDAQADHLRGRYELVEHLGGSRWRIRNLPPDDAEVDRILDYFARNEARGHGFDCTVEALMAEVAERSAGREMEVEFVSAERYAAYF